ncbi:RNA polymerase sigma factor [Paludisphaera borealis]|uniref:RNA polymerase sigma factor CnrH n=1 Tax=Paludisphaera borealis TaxID=1387353 RepID=A0A1U7CL90_9BACT|nr:sigma-70 family RNA polymerase sigma factor [Paludisphaera borealis]APW59676.1 RNA polymerase sigma factor CnrH [Paludisphaera borealis]
MLHVNEGSTNPALLELGADWSNHDAWVELLRRHDPLIRRCCAYHGLTDADADEVRQETWIELATRLRRFRYDPGRSFRGWLWIVCRNKAMSFLRLNKKHRIENLDEWMTASRADPDSSLVDDEPIPSRTAAGTDGGTLELLFAKAARIQADVRARVEPSTWEAFWLADVYLWNMEDVAAHLGISLAAAYKATQRMRGRLREEGERTSEPPVAR